MKVGIIILCRLGSTRLPGKILMMIRGKSILSHIVDRIKIAAPKNEIIVATSENASDDPIAQHCRRSHYKIFRGNLENVAHRFLYCGIENNFDYLVRINGDNLFVDNKALASMIAIAQTNQYDFITNVPGRTFPYGMSIEIVKTSFYKELLEKKFTGSHDQEHVTSWLYDNEHIGTRYIYTNQDCKEFTGHNLAIDTQEDFDQAEKMINLSTSEPALLSLNELYMLYKNHSLKSRWSGKHGPLLIAEIGGNHEGNFDKAKELASLAIKSGADCIKFQLYQGDTLVSKVESPDRAQHFKKFELSKEEHIYLAKMCIENGLSYNASVWDLEMLEWIDPYLDFYKIGSGDLTAWPIIQEFAKRGKPILLSSGLATLEEVLQTIEFIQSINPVYLYPAMLCIMQCTSMYPIDRKDANINVMRELGLMTGLSVGYSDHTVGSEALKIAATMGANVLEFHFTDSRKGKVFRDHKVSLTADEVQMLIEELRIIREFQGSSLKLPQDSEIENNHHISFRRGIYLKNSVKKGQEIKKNDLCFLRPAHGTDSRDVSIVIGAKALKDLEPKKAISSHKDYLPIGSSHEK